MPELQQVGDLPACAEHHRQSRRGSDANRTAAVNETAATRAYLA